MQKEKYLLSYNGQYYEASHAIVELVEELQRYEEEKAAIEAYVRKKEGKYTPEQVREVIEKFIDPIFRAVPKKRSFLYEKGTAQRRRDRPILGYVPFFIP